MVEHGGNLAKYAELAGCPASEILDFSISLNPDGPPEGLFQVCFRALDELGPYQPAHADGLCRLAGKKWGIAPEKLLFGNGSGELLDLFVRASRPPRAVIVTPGYLEYDAVCRRAGIPVAGFPLKEENGFRLQLSELGNALRPGDLVIFGNPDNPTGGMVPASELHDFILAHSGQTFLIDEAFADFTGDTLLKYPLPGHAAVLRSMTKFFSVAGLRLGYIAAAVKIIADMRDLQIPWSIGTVALRAAEFLLARPEDPGHAAELREELSAGLSAAGLKVYPSAANFLLVRTPRPLFPELLKEKIAVRDCSNFPGLDDCFIRIGLRRREDNLKLLAAVRKIMKLSPPNLSLPKKKPALMIQGTCSNAGKSVLCAAFCRILLQDGYAVAPFKAQNMSLNSAVTPDGGEIGRAQAVQAEACRIDPDVRMNPILLKPNSELGSQVILLGKPLGNFKVRDYFARKKELWNDVKRAYDSLSANYDCMVLEGAGSPGEINLKNTDVVNMRMAQYAQAPVLLAGDIDRGGVYASFIGTYATFEPWERELLYGFAVNKFRGDPTLLDDAHRYVARMTGKEVAAVFDFLPGLGLPEEDSVGFAFAPRAEKRSDSLDIAVVRLGHIANFTDFAPLDIEPDVQIRVVEHGDELGEPDVILLPGSKSVADDIGRMRRNGLFDKVKNSRAFLVGICGGLQILGEKLLDPERIESDQTETACLGLLPLTTRMNRKKTLLHNSGVTRDGLTVRGYEIHHGETVCIPREGLHVMLSPDGRELGYEAEGVLATYLHGIFDDDAFRRHFLNGLRRRKGLSPLPQQTEYGFEPALNRLADHVRARIDLKKLYRKIGV
ncbi:MAG: cobyric acid synthase [Lentisphaeria bacterium]|nr:cobyric acid synthase [Lentisphaeria bacterium]